MAGFDVLFFDILNHRADDLVVPGPGIGRRGGAMGEHLGFSSRAKPYEGLGRGDVRHGIQELTVEIGGERRNGKISNSDFKHS
jgi:hypothetical protein